VIGASGGGKSSLVRRVWAGLPGGWIIVQLTVQAAIHSARWRSGRALLLPGCRAAFWQIQPRALGVRWIDKLSGGACEACLLIVIDNSSNCTLVSEHLRASFVEFLKELSEHNHVRIVLTWADFLSALSGQSPAPSTGNSVVLYPPGAATLRRSSVNRLGSSAWR
jgi:hypothetical protein